MGKMIYALYDSGNILGHYCAREVQTITGMKTNMVSCYAETGLPYHKRYTMVKVKEALPKGIEDWAEEWEEARKRVLAAGRS